jgi:hypothetical protein
LEKFRFKKARHVHPLVLFLEIRSVLFFVFFTWFEGNYFDVWV